MKQTSMWAVLSLGLLACGGGAAAKSAEDGKVGDQAPRVRAAVSEEQARAQVQQAIAAASAKQPERLEVQAGGETVVLWAWDEPRLILSEHCVQDGKPSACDALTALQRVATVDVTVGGGNPSSHYCTPSGGEALAAKDARGESELCKYADGSMIDSWSLVYVHEK